MDWERLKNLGRDWRSQFQTIEFIGEIEVEPSTIKEVCQVAGRYLHMAAVNEDFRSTLAVTVVNLAYDAEENENTPQSFRERVLKKFGLPADTSVWEKQIGKPVAELLEKYFRERPTHGPYRYVTPILRQAGVPARSAYRFSIFFRELIQRIGWEFSKPKYDKFIGSRVLPSTLKEFLPTETGWRFCLDLARVLRHRQLGLVSEETLRRLPGFRGPILERLWQSIQTIPAQNKRIPQPRLILDVSERRLALQFAEEGLDSSYFWADGRRIRQSRYYLGECDFDRALTVKIRQLDGRIDYCPIELWRPEQRQWASFHHIDSAYQNTDCLPPGRHLLAIPDYVEFPAETKIYEEIGALYLPGWRGSAMRVVDCELPPGLCLPEIGLAVDDRSVGFPSLSFGREPSPWPNAHHVFSGQLPEISISNWSADFAQKYLLIIDDGSGERLCDESLFRDTGNFHCHVNAPAQGRIRIEPRGRTPRGFARAELSFVLLPRDTRLEWPRLLQPDDDAILALYPPEKFRVEWAQEEIEQIDLGCWRVPQNLNFVEGRVVYQNDVSFSIAGHIYRLAMSGSAVKGNILWRDQIKQRADLQIKLSPSEAGQRIEFGALRGSQFLNAVSLGPVPARGLLDLNTDAIRDALENLPQPVSILAIRLPKDQILSVGKDRILRTGAIYIDGQRLQEHLLAEQNPGEQDWERNLPKALRHSLRCVQRLRDEPLDELPLSGDYQPDSLYNFLHEIEICWLVFDKGADEEQLDPTPNPNLRALLAWFCEARRLLATPTLLNPQSAQEMLEHMPDAGSLLPIGRWQEALNRVAEHLRRIKDWMNEVRQWGLRCRNNQWRQAQESAIGQLPGGKTLTSGAKDYQTALEQKINNQPDGFRNWLGGAYKKFEQAASESRQGIVWEIATALRAMTFYHFGHSSFTTEANHAINRLSADWERLKCTLRSLQGQNAVGAHAATSLGLSDISPHREDLKLEI